MAISARHIYWANWGTGTIGRANLDGTDVSQRPLTVGYHPAARPSTPGHT